MTFLIIISSVAYLLIAIFAALMTYSEQQFRKTRSPILKCAGYLACAFWPVTFLAVAVSAGRRSA